MFLSKVTCREILLQLVPHVIYFNYFNIFVLASASQFTLTLMIEDYERTFFWTARFWGLSAHMIDISCTHSWCSYGIYFESSHRVAYISFSILFLLMDLDHQLVFIYFGSVGKVTSFGFRPNKIDITRCSGASTANYMYVSFVISLKEVSQRVTKKTLSFLHSFDWRVIHAAIKEELPIRRRAIPQNSALVNLARKLVTYNERN